MPFVNPSMIFFCSCGIYKCMVIFGHTSHTFIMVLSLISMRLSYSCVCFFLCKTEHTICSEFKDSNIGTFQVWAPGTISLSPLTPIGQLRNKHVKGLPRLNKVKNLDEIYWRKSRKLPGTHRGEFWTRKTVFGGQWASRLDWWRQKTSDKMT